MDSLQDDRKISSRTLLGYASSGIISNIITQGWWIGESREYFYGYLDCARTVASKSPAYWVSRKELKEEANLLLPKPPVSGSKISERLQFIWKRLSFNLQGHCS